MRFQRSLLAEEAAWLSGQIKTESRRSERDGIYLLECHRDYARLRNLIRYMDWLEWDECEFLGATEAERIPVVPGQIVTIPKGAVKFQRVDGRESSSFVWVTHNILVETISRGIERFSDPDRLLVENPMIQWTKGIYTFWMDLNFCPEANDNWANLIPDDSPAFTRVAV